MNKRYKSEFEQFMLKIKFLMTNVIKPAFNIFMKLSENYSKYKEKQ